MELGGTGLQAVLEEFQVSGFGADDEEDGKPEKVDKSHFERVLSGVVERQAEIDRGVNEGLRDGWPPDRLDATVRALYALVPMNSLPAKTCQSALC